MGNTSANFHFTYFLLVVVNSELKEFAHIEANAFFQERPYFVELCCRQEKQTRSNKFVFLCKVGEKNNNRWIACDFMTFSTVLQSYLGVK